MSKPTLAEIKALAFRLAPGGCNRSPITGAKPTKADLARLADLILGLETDPAHGTGAVPAERLRELLKGEA